MNEFQFNSFELALVVISIVEFIDQIQKIKVSLLNSDHIMLYGVVVLDVCQIAVYLFDRCADYVKPALENIWLEIVGFRWDQELTVGRDCVQRSQQVMWYRLK